jgi:two-component system sensor histidine kinase KdpD
MGGAEDRRGVASLERLTASPGSTRIVLGVLAAVAGVAAAAAIGSLPSPPSAVIAALLDLLVITAAASLGRLWPALLAAALAFATLDFQFTPPRHTFRVSKAEDVLALGIFLAVAVVVSAFVARVVEDRRVAQSRERQIRALYRFSSRLLSGDDVASVLADLAATLQVLFGARGCLVALRASGPEVVARSGDLEGREVLRIPLLVDEDELGHVDLAGADPRRLAGPGRELVQALAAQLALGIERMRLDREASGARLEAEASRTRAALFSSVTHDLRTPLASIMSSASSLLEEGVPFSDEQRRDLLRTILEETERLNRVVGNLMDISRLRAGALVPSVELVAVEELVGSVVRRLGRLLADRPVRVKVREDVPMVAVDVVQVDQALTNLLENAVRYSAPGSEIGVTAVRWAGMIELKVIDHGPGIPAEDRERVFEEFYRRDVDGRKGGSGLGLAIARAVVLAHGGTIGIEETPGGGTTVGLRLPAAALPEGTP